MLFLIEETTFYFTYIYYFLTGQESLREIGSLLNAFIYIFGSFNWDFYLLQLIRRLSETPHQEIKIHLFGAFFLQNFLVQSWKPPTQNYFFKTHISSIMNQC